jgi:hypothetical protein
VAYYAVTRERGGNWDASLAMREQEKSDEHAVLIERRQRLILEWVV